MSDLLTRFPVYQVDFQAVNAGKTVASTKRKIRWRFGFPNRQALDAGRTGIDCRGEEHDVVVIWSIASGKRQVYMDGTEIHFSTSRASTFQYSWSSKGNHVMKVLAHAAPPVNATPGFRQYDMFIDGQSFFTMPKAFEIGIRPTIRGPPHDYRSHGGYASSPPPVSSSSSGFPVPRNRYEEDSDLQAAINASLQESKQYLASRAHSDTAPPPAAPEVADLMGLDVLPQTVAVNAPPAQAVGYNNYSAYPPPGQYAQPSPQQNGYHHDQQQQQYGYSQPPPQGNQYQGPSPAATSGALVLSNAPNQGYSVPPATPTYQAPAPPAFASPASVAPSYAYPSSAASVAPSYASQPSAYGAPPPQQQQYQQFQSQQQPQQQQQQQSVPTGNLFAPPPVDAFAPRSSVSGDFYGFSSPVVDDPFAPKPPPPPTRQDITNNILNQYGGGGPQQQQQPLGTNNGQPVPGAAGPALTMNGYAPTSKEEEKPESEMEKAMKRLVNVERIDEPAEKEYKLTMMNKEADEKKKKKGKSHGLPPAATGLVGSNATLADIYKVKNHTPKTGEGVMRNPPTAFHPDAVHAGALVVHGQGPPPIQRGFGVGFGGVPPPYNYNQQRW